MKSFNEVLSGLGLKRNFLASCVRNQRTKERILKLLRYKQEHSKLPEEQAVLALIWHVAFLYFFLKGNKVKKTKGKDKTVYLVPGINLPEILASQKEEIIKFLETEGLEAEVKDVQLDEVRIPHAWHMQLHIAA